MKQAMFLPHQILGCLFSAGRMDLIAGNIAPWLISYREIQNGLTDPTIW